MTVCRGSDRRRGGRARDREPRRTEPVGFVPSDAQLAFGRHRGPQRPGRHEVFGCSGGAHARHSTPLPEPIAYETDECDATTVPTEGTLRHAYGSSPCPQSARRCTVGTLTHAYGLSRCPQLARSPRRSVCATGDSAVKGVARARTASQV